MITIDGKPLDLSNLQNTGITLKPGGFIEQLKDGVVTRVENKPETPTQDLNTRYLAT